MRRQLATGGRQDGRAGATAGGKKARACLGLFSPSVLATLEVVVYRTGESRAPDREADPL
jgi:hypothetical protein